MERLFVEVGRSRYYCLLCIAVYISAFVALLVTRLDWYVVAGLGLALVVSATFHIRRYGILAAPDSVVAVEWRDGVWRLELADGRWVRTWIDKTVTLTRWLVVLNFTDGHKKRYAVALLPDSTDADSFRRTRILLRLMPRPEDGA